MSQQINLFNPLFLTQKKYFSAVAMLQALGLLAVGVAAFYGYAISQRASVQSSAAETARAYAAGKDRFARLSAELSPDRAGREMEESMKTAAAELAARQALLSQLHSGVSGTSGGYAQFLKALARQSLNGVWLTSIQVDNDGQNLTIRGRATQAEILTAYIQRLGREQALKGRPFEKLEIARREMPGATPGATLGFVEFAMLSSHQDDSVLPAAAASAEPAPTPAAPAAKAN